VQRELYRGIDQYLCLYFWDFPNLEGQVPVFISPRNRVAQLYPRALGETANQSKAKVTLRPEVSRPVRLGVRHPSGTRGHFFHFSVWLFLDSYGFVDVERPLWREDGSVICSAMTQVQLQVVLRPTICQPVCLGAGPPMGPPFLSSIVQSVILTAIA
jgi:hypothetical protein